MNVVTIDSPEISGPLSEAVSKAHLATETDRYQQAYTLRRTMSTMAAVAREHLATCAGLWAADAASQKRPFRILSVGCGDGDMDLPMLQRLGCEVEVDYLGLDVNPVSAKLFRKALQALEPGLRKKMTFNIRVESAQQMPAVGDGFDLVLMSHVLYYFDEPASLVRRYLHQACRIDGRLLIVHSGWQGIPRLMSQVPGLTPFLSAEDICDTLQKDGLRVESEMLETALDAREILAQSPAGEQVLGFCVERELEQLTADTRRHLLKALWQQSHISRGEVWLREALGFLMLRNDLGSASQREPRSDVRLSDPVEDYHQLAQAFSWSARLRALSAEPVRVLDVGCGRGRWLKVLQHHWPELAKARSAIEYSAIDPSAVALAQARDQSQAWSHWGRGWSQKIEDIADLPTAHYDLAWSLHSLYCVARADLSAVLARLVQSLKPDGVAVIAMPNRHSFYITAAERLTDQPRFTCAEDVFAVLRLLGLTYEVREVAYEERISALDQQALRTYVWEESIGNSYSSAHEGVQAAPPLPEDPWLLSHRQGDVFAFPQNVQVITVRGGQSIEAPRSKLQPDAAQMRHWAGLVSELGVREHADLPQACVTIPVAGVQAPAWVHQTQHSGAHEQAALHLYECLMREPLPEWGNGDLEHLLQTRLRPLLEQGTLDNAPGYMGYIPSGGLYLGALAEWLGALLNRYSAMFMAAPGLAAVESQCIGWLTELTGLQAQARAHGVQAGGLLVSGASMATVTAVHAARQKALSRGEDARTLVAYLGNTAHGCVAQALSVCGIAHQRAVAIGPDHRVDMQALARVMAEDRRNGLTPFLMALSAGEVQTGAIDDLAAGRALADEAAAWLHVDGAYGGFFAIAPSAPQALQHIRLADSLSLDPHKGMGLPYGTGALLVRNVNDLRHAFANNDDYLPPTPGLSRPPDVMDLGIEMTRPARGLRLWLPMQMLGLAPFRDHLEHMLHLTRWLAGQLRSQPAIEVLAEPGLSVCCFRLRAPANDALNRQLLDAINADGRFFLTGCTLSAPHSGFALRVALLSFRTDAQTVQALVEHIRAAVQELMP